jgi:hypothetical protein
MKKYEPTIAQEVFGTQAWGEFEADEYSDGLYELSKQLCKIDSSKQDYGFLGGEFGYGQDFKNELFEMFPYYWGDCDCGYHNYGFDEVHINCYQNEFKSVDDKYGMFGTWAKCDGSKDKIEKEREKIFKEELVKLYSKHGLEYDKEDVFAGCAVRCSCDYDKRYQDWLVKIGYPNGHKLECTTLRPNFKHYKSGLEIRWYKYIGRGMTANIKDIDFYSILNECLESIKTPSSPNN